jgi:hypothetical protein
LGANLRGGGEESTQNRKGSHVMFKLKLNDLVLLKSVTGMHGILHSAESHQHAPFEFPYTHGK